MAYYLCAIFLSTILVAFSQRGKISSNANTNVLFRKFCALFSVFPLAIISGLRYGNGADYFSYESIFNLVRSGIYEGTSEKGYLWLNQIIAFFTDNATILFLVTSFMICGLFFYAIYHFSEDKYLSVWLFFLTSTYFDTFNAIRQYMACAIFFNAIHYIQSKNFKKYAIMILIATLFHTSAIVLLPIYFICNMKLNGWKAIAILLLECIGGSAILQVLQNILRYTPYARYIGSSEMMVDGTKQSLVYITIITVIALWQRRKGNVSSKFQLLFNMQIVTECVVVASLLIPFSRRLQMYFLPTTILFIPLLIKAEKKRVLKYLLLGIICTMYIAIMIWSLYVQGWYTAVPYRCVLFKP
ncbi:MAG: EpsG family protein [Oscillospiraceae bacterium]